MAKAKVLLKRRKSVRNTKKITRTMEMVSTAKYKQTYGRIANSGPYQEKLREMMADLSAAGAEVSHPLLEERPVKRSILLVVTANRGLCGGYNANLNALALRTLQTERAQGIETELHVVGNKGLQFFRLRGEEMAGQYTEFGDKMTYAGVNELSSQFIRRYSEGEIDRVTIIYQKFISMGRQAAVADTLLPLGGLDVGEEGAEAANEKQEANYLFSPDPQSLMQELLPAYFRTTVWNDFLQALVSEHLARMVAMKNATDAADKLIKTLTRLYNRARQTQITNEIAELMGGVEALK